MKYLGGKIFFILGFLLCSGFFYCQNCQAAAAGAVVINEIAWMGTVNSPNDEWLELANRGDEDVVIEGWTLTFGTSTPKKIAKCQIVQPCTVPAGGFFLLERTDDTSAPPPADYIYTSALNDNGEVLELKDDSGALIDRLDASAKWPAGNKDSRLTMERAADDSWCSSQSAGGTPKAANDCADQNSAANLSANPATPAETGGGSAPGYRYGDVLINEFESDPPAGENEWVELYNPGGGAIPLTGWTIADGSGKETPLAGGFDENNYFFFTAEKFKGALNNDGDGIYLYNGAHALIDEVAYGKFGDQPDNNAPAPGKGQSTALKIDGKKALFDKDSYAVTITPTEGGTNIITAPASQTDDSSTSSAAIPGDISITEIFPNPAGSDRSGEFIELYNNSDALVDLTGYRIDIVGGRSFEFGKFFNPTHSLPAGGYFALYRSASNLVLDNNGGTIKLYAPGKTRAAQSLQYDQAEEGYSYCDTAQLDLRNANSATKKFLNNSLLLSRWVWSATPTPGAANQIKTPNNPPRPSFSAPAKIIAGVAVDFDASDSFDEDGDPLSFAWDFGDGGRQIIEDPVHTFLTPGNYQIKLAVSDGEDSATVAKIIKVGGISPASFAAAAGAAAVGSGSAINSTQAKIAVNSPPPALPKNSGKTLIAKAANPIEAKIKVAALAPMPVSSAAIDRLKLGAAWKITGTVIVLPGNFGTQYFYVSAGTSSPAVKIYNYYHDFPVLKIGDVIEAAGVIGGSATDKYLKTKTAANVKILSQKDPPAPEQITAAGFKEENLGKFVQTEGEIESKNGQLVTLFDGSADFAVYLKAAANVSAADFKVGQKISVTGLLTKVANNLAVMPRSSADLALSASTSPSADDNSGSVLGAATGSSAWTLPAPKNNSQALIYLLIAAGGAIIVLAGWISKKYFFKKKAG